MRIGIVVFPGSNCDRDCFYAVKNVFNQDAEYIWHKDTVLDRFGCIILPGGFSYGDYLRPGAIARFSPVMNKILDFAKAGGLVVGICNGFQILLEAGLLPGVMLRNSGLRFICRYVYIKTENNKTPFTNLSSEGHVFKIPIAHNEGNYYIGDEGLKSLKENNQIVFRYCDKDGTVSKENNPNGALENIAGIVNKQGNVLGMMPHPERSSENALGSEDGAVIFNSIFNWLEEKQQ